MDSILEALPLSLETVKAGLADLTLDSAKELLATGYAWVAGNATAVFVGVPLATTILWFTASRLTHPLRRYPGPFLACGYAL